MNIKKMRLGLIGKDVSKSTSDVIHRFILGQWGVNCEYEKISVVADGFDPEMRRLIGDFDGFSVTIPYKREVFGYLDEVVGDAMAFGAVNTVVVDGLKGYNTDGAGFLLMLRMAGIDARGKRILVLGAGGSGRSSAVALKNAGANVEIYQRNREKLKETCEELGLQAAQDPQKGGYEILVNCTGVGMHDSEGVSPVTARAFAGAQAAVDLIYTPSETEFLRLAKTQGLRTLNGAAMLFYQAYYADCLFLGRQADENEAKKFYEKYLETREA